MFLQEGDLTGFSPLADLDQLINGQSRSSPRGSRVSGLGLHHNAGVDAYGQASAPGREVSANYWIANNGDLIPNVDESRRAWTSGHPAYPAGAAADHRNITVEISNSAEGVRNGTWAISAAARKTLVALIADVYTRYGLGPVKRGADQGVGVHRDWVQTECPGGYVMAELPSIIAEAETLRTNPAANQKPAVPTKGEPMPTRKSTKQYKPPRTGKGAVVLKPRTWTGLHVNDKGWLAFLENQSKETFGTLYANVHVDGEADIRFRYYETDTKTGKSTITGSSASQRIDTVGTFVWPFSLSKRAGSVVRKIAVEARPVGSGELRQVALATYADYWEK